MPVPLKILLRILAVGAIGIARIIAAFAQVFAEVFGIVAYEVLVPVVAVLQEAEGRLSQHTEADDSYQRFDVSTLKGEKE